ncbi:MAG: outer membrane lipoprotein carrier protein LolA [Bacteroidales bacterium]|nr:outer membrane lipoprotein carrier protein LolA [Bacteroidales bacterium]MDY4521457.1 outer membrane lipoprotein carrier protein LolA [Bacteroidales bacterium]
MKILAFAATAAALCFCFNANAELKGANSNEYVAKVQKANEQLTTMQCSFVRKTKMAALNDVVSEKGTFYFSNPDNLSMKYDNGENFVITADNVSLTVGGKARTLRSGNRHVEELSETLIACVRGLVSSIDGTLKSGKVQGKNIVFKISSELKVGRSEVNSIELTYDKTDFSLVSLNLIEKDGSYTIYELGTKTKGSKIDSSVFQHANPKKKK